MTCSLSVPIRPHWWQLPRQQINLGANRYMLDTKRDCVAPKEIVSKLFNLVDHDDAHKKPLSSQYARCPRMAGCSPTAMSQGPDKLSPIRTFVWHSKAMPTWSVTQNRRGRGLWRSKHGLTMRVITAFLRTNIEIWPIAKNLTLFLLVATSYSCQIGLFSPRSAHNNRGPTGISSLTRA